MFRNLFQRSILGLVDTRIRTPSFRISALNMEASTSVSSDIAQASASVQEWTDYISPRLSEIRQRVEGAKTASTVRLVAVSKIKPAQAVRACYDLGQRSFGENYVQELVEKANDPLLKDLDDISWHLVGRLQSNKASLVVKKVPKLSVVETVENEKLASKLNTAVKAAIDEGIRKPADKLSVLVQVNTSGEPQKGGVEPSDAEGSLLLPLCTYIANNCEYLKFSGLMTIGMPDYTSRPENFECLLACRKVVALHLGIEESSLELSMGMSGDFEAALKMGSTNIRVGSSIFGDRPKKN